LVDDVWSAAAWNLIRSSLPSSNCGSKIIVTTRIHTVAKAYSDANDGNIHVMKKLEQEDSKKLFVSKVFCRNGFTTLPSVLIQKQPAVILLLERVLVS
jgi:disease resistance protein RPM1